jgi:hypothetical protein
MHFCFSEDGPASPDQCWMTASLQIRHSRLLATFSVSPAGRLPSTEGSSRLVRWHNPGIHGCSSATVNWCFRALAAACVMIEPGLNLLWAYRLELRCFLMCFCTRPSSSGPAQQQCLRRCRVTGIFCWLLTMHQSPVRGVAWAISTHILGPGIQFCCVHAGHACSYFPDTHHFEETDRYRNAESGMEQIVGNTTLGQGYLVSTQQRHQVLLGTPKRD